MVFDLKGSTINRKVSLGPDDRKFWRTSLNHKKDLKDLNYLEICKDMDSSLMNISKHQFDELENLISNDSQFLKRMKLMDYSLLLTIESVKVEQQDTAAFVNTKMQRLSSFDNLSPQSLFESTDETLITVTNLSRNKFESNVRIWDPRNANGEEPLLFK
jgi:hypothetical protein